MYYWIYGHLNSERQACKDLKICQVHVLCYVDGNYPVMENCIMKWHFKEATIVINADLLFSNILGEFAAEVDISGECEKQENVAVIDIGNFELSHTNNGEFIFIKIILKLSSMNCQ